MFHLMMEKITGINDENHDGLEFGNDHETTKASQILTS